MISTFANLNDHWSLLIFRMIIASFSIIGNSLILYIFIRYREFRKTNSNFFIGLLALGDLCLGLGLFIRGLYSICVIINDIYIYNTTFCIWISLPQIYGIAFSYIQICSLALERCLAIVYPIKFSKHRNILWLWLSVIIGFLCSSTIFIVSLISDRHTSINQCAIGSATKYFDMISSIYGFIIAAFIIVTYSIALYFLHKRLINIKANVINMGILIKTEKRVFAYVTIIIILYLIFCSFPLVSMVILHLFNVSNVWMGYASVFVGLGHGINSSVGIFVYIRKHSELQKYLKNIIPFRIFILLSGTKTVGSPPKA